MPRDPREASELQALMRSDIEHIRGTWNREIDVHTLRREASMLRRLTVDNGGDIARLWKLQGRPGKPLIPESFDLARLPTFDGLAFATAETISRGEVQMSATLLWEEAKRPDAASLRVVEGPDIPVTIRTYLTGVCLVLQAKPVRRSDLITYIANKRGGDHYDRRRDSGDPKKRAAHLALDELSDGGWRINDKDAVFAQFMAIGINIARAPDVQVLCGD